MKTVFRAGLFTLLLTMLLAAPLSASVSRVSGGTVPPIYFPFVEHLAIGDPTQYFTSYLEIHNRSSTMQAFSVVYYNNDGSVYGEYEYAIQGKNTLQVIPPYGFSGAAAVVPRLGAITAIAHWDATYEGWGTMSVAAYTGISQYANGTNAGWGVPGTSIYVPSVKYREVGPGEDPWRTTLHIQNTGSELAAYVVSYYDANGNPICSFPGRLLNPKGWEHMAFPAEICGTDFIGSARVSATEPLAVAVTVGPPGLEHLSPLQHGHPTLWQNLGFNQYNAFSAGAQTVYLPSLMRAWYSWTSEFVVHNLSNNQATTITVEYYRDDGSDPVISDYALGPRASLAVSQGNEPDLGDGWHGSARLTSSTTQVAVVVYQVDDYHFNSFQAYSGNLGAPTWTRLSGPFTSHYEAGGEPFDSGIEVQNCGTASADISGTYWHRWGTPAGTVSAEDVPVWRTHTFYTPGDVPSPFSGAMEVVGGPPLCGVVSLFFVGPPIWDQGASYNMVEIYTSPTSSD